MITTENLENKLVVKIGFHFVIKKAKSHILLNGDLSINGHPQVDIY